MSKTLYEAIGQEDSIKAFAPGDATHHSNYGSYELARCIVESIRSQNLPLAKFLLSGLASFDPAHPDPLASFHMPATPRAPVQQTVRKLKCYSRGITRELPQGSLAHRLRDPLYGSGVGAAETVSSIPQPGSLRQH